MGKDVTWEVPAFMTPEQPESGGQSIRGKKDPHGLRHDGPTAQVPYASSVEIPSPVCSPGRACLPKALPDSEKVTSIEHGASFSGLRSW